MFVANICFEYGWLISYLLQTIESYPKKIGMIKHNIMLMMIFVFTHFIDYESLQQFKGNRDEDQFVFWIA